MAGRVRQMVAIRSQETGRLLNYLLLMRDA